MLGKIKSIEEVFDLRVNPEYSMDGYKVETEKHIFYILIDNKQSCSESWGYLSSEDNLNNFIGANLIEIKLTDKALNQSVVDNSGYYEDNGGIQFVDFITDQGIFQLAVYNAHNGYYGHGILVTKDNEVLMKVNL